MLVFGASLLVVTPAQAVTTVAVLRDGTLYVTNERSQVIGVSVGRGRYFVSTGEPVRTSSSCRPWGGGYNATCPADLVRRVFLDLRGGSDSGVIHPSVAVPVEVRGGRGDDYLEAGQRPGPIEEYEERREPALVPVRFDGGPGVDTVIGGAADDVLIGGAGPDRLFGGAGADALLGGGGDDVLLADDGGADRLDCGAGADRLRPDVGVDAVAGCEQPPSEYGLEESPAVVDHRFAAYPDGRTRLTRLRARALPEGAGVTVTCRGRGCPFESRRDGDAAPRWSAPPALLRRRLPTGARVEVAVTAPGHLTKIVRLTMRRRAQPARRVYCAGPLSGLVTVCLSASWAPGQGIAP
jgi:hypothetical protein